MMPITAIEVVTEPLYEPVSLAEAKSWLRIDTTDEDALVRGLIKSFRQKAENLTLRSFVRRTLKLTLYDWPRHHRYGHVIELPRPPLLSVSSFQYTDSDGVLTEMTAADSVVHNEAEPGFIVPAWNATWPTIRLVPDAVQVTYLAGYAPGSPDDEAGYQENVPEALKTWMETNIAALEQNREAMIVGTSAMAVPRSFSDGLLDHLVLGRRLF